MKSFKTYMGEAFDFPIASPSEDGKHELATSKNLHNPDIRAVLNVVLLRVTDGLYANPWTALNNAAKQLGFYGIQLPKVTFPSVEGGEVVWKIDQFGQAHGFSPVKGSENDTDEQLFLYFEYQLGEDGRYICYAELVNDSTLDAYLNDSETVKEEVELDEQMFAHKEMANSHKYLVSHHSKIGDKHYKVAGEALRQNHNNLHKLHTAAALAHYKASEAHEEAHKAYSGDKAHNASSSVAVRASEHADKKTRLTEETITETLEDHHERLVSGVADGKGFQKTFESADHQNKWVAAQKDVSIHNVQRVHEEENMSDEKVSLFELSPGKILQYVAKSSRDKKDRQKGIDAAAKKLKVEEVENTQLDELSTKKMLQYTAKAGRDKKDRSKGLDKVSKKVVGEEEVAEPKRLLYFHELSNGKMLQYVAKAARDKKDRSKGLDKVAKKVE